MVCQHGYQQIEEGDVVTITKLKGVIVTNFSDKGLMDYKDMYTRVWDSSEYASTSSESRGFFVATNVIITPNQTIGNCDEGGVIVVNIQWICNLDRDFIEYCKPKYKFKRVDNDGLNKLKGYSFRKAYHHDLNRRSLVKYHGIMFVIRNEAIGRKFSFVKLVINFAIGLALLRLSILLPNFSIWVMKKMNIHVARIDRDAGKPIPEKPQEMSENHKQLIP
ncbi:hypothetical protein J437_LFUL003556 [Ladona fulva]|uniref:Uncharacterized protein n=1 Tax=Ladona fulva TaxID=123851 RepID=A0A8K0NSM8_LADFU|nr:hypothetical protein J437_LFUL003556 [Ladona fulva]